MVKGHIAYQLGERPLITQNGNVATVIDPRLAYGISGAILSDKGGKGFGIVRTIHHRYTLRTREKRRDENHRHRRRHPYI